MPENSRHPDAPVVPPLVPPLVPRVVPQLEATEVLTRGDDAYARIRRDILSCHLMPGASTTESQLMSDYGIGKNSVRIALVRLIQEGFVRSIPRQGYRITPITLKDVEEVFALRVQLEPLAARLACGRVDVELLRRLEVACRVPYPERALSDQIGVFLDANREFHLAIAAASGNDRLLHTLASLLDEMSRLVALGFGVQRTKPEIKHDHNAMIDAFIAGDGRRAETIARRHIETFRDMTMEKVYASLSNAGASLPLFSVTELRR